MGAESINSPFLKIECKYKMQTQVHVMVFHLNLYLRIEADKMCMHDLSALVAQLLQHMSRPVAFAVCHVIF